MSLRCQAVPHVPRQTAAVARSAFPRGNLYLTMRDELGALYSNVEFASLYSPVGQPAFSPWRLALGTGDGDAVRGEPV